MTNKRVYVDQACHIANPTAKTAYHNICDADGKPICQHQFAYPEFGSALDTLDWFNAQLRIAQAIADALNAVPGAAIEYIRQIQREAQHLQDQASRTKKDPP